MSNICEGLDWSIGRSIDRSIDVKIDVKIDVNILLTFLAGAAAELRGAADGEPEAEEGGLREEGSEEEAEGRKGVGDRRRGNQSPPGF